MILPSEFHHSTNNKIERRGMMIVISSPSGAGKSTIARHLHEDDDMNLAISVSVTTRERRPSEIDNVHYHFIDFEEFKYLRDSNEFLEWAEVHGNYYATLRETVKKGLEKGKDILFDVDYQGASQLRQKTPQDVISIFIIPPSMRELSTRLHHRSEDSQQVIDARLASARIEMRHWKNYDYIIINENLNQALAEVKAIIISERLKHHCRLSLQKFIDNLISEKL